MSFGSSDFAYEISILAHTPQALDVYQRLGLKSSTEMAKLSARHGSVGGGTLTSPEGQTNMGSAGYGYAWVPPGLSRTKVFFHFFIRYFIF
jgi:hypothetical protein